MALLWLCTGIMVSLLFLGGCASTQAYDTSLPKIFIQRATIEEIKKFGTTFASNPYLEPATLLGGKKYEFFVVRIDLNLDKNESVEVDAFAQVPAGVPVPQVHTKNSLIEFWEFIDEGAKLADFEKRKTTIEITAIPSTSFRESSGQHRYYLVFSGKYPIKKPVSYHVRVFLSSGESVSFSDTIEQ